GRAGASGGGGGAGRGGPPSVPVRARDSTGAGDAFTGALLAALLGGADLVAAAEQGCGAGARAVTRAGGRPPGAVER
ncbi:PfkB family carbohydrate kinase, partial [Streptomyces formicae]